MKPLSLLLLLFLLFVMPVVVLVLSSLAPGWRFSNVWPEAFSLRAVTYLVQHKDQILVALGSSFLFSLLTILTTLVMCLLPVVPLLSSSNRSLASILTLIFLFLPVALFVIMDTTLVRAYRKRGTM
ncbi:MAG: hypothetical protein ACQET7_03035 [Thermodesulfobacteriota bacterium]